MRRMKIQQLRTDVADLPSALVDMARIKPQLVFVFASPAALADGVVVEILTKRLSGATVVGSSTAGDISREGVSDNGVVVTGVHFRRSHVQAYGERVGNNDDSYSAGTRLARWFHPEGLRAVIVLAPGFDVNGSALVRGLQEHLPVAVPVSGGLAADQGGYAQSYTVLDRQVDDRLAVAIGLYGDALTLGHASFGGWEPYGAACKVTRCSGNKLLELDGEPALAVYERHLGERALELPRAGLLFPFEVLSAELGDTGVVRTLLGVNRSQGSLTLAGEIEADGYLRLMHASTEKLVGGAHRAAVAARGDAGEASLALLVSCIGRRLVMGARVDEEVQAVAGVFNGHTVMTGFYSNGEISPHGGGASKLYNQTMTITCLGERL
jgi:hypothetical protein